MHEELIEPLSYSVWIKLSSMYQLLLGISFCCNEDVLHILHGDKIHMSGCWGTVMKKFGSTLLFMFKQVLAVVRHEIIKVRSVRKFVFLGFCCPDYLTILPLLFWLYQLCS
jgi:hypothetical protein